VFARETLHENTILTKPNIRQRVLTRQRKEFLEMAFTFCTNCGEQIDISLEKCPHCGHPTGAQRNYTYGMDPTAVNRPQQNAQNGNTDAPPPGGNTENGESSGNQSGFGGDAPSNNGQNQNPYGQNQNPYGQNQNPYGQNQNPYGQNQNPYGQNQNPYGQNQNPYGQDQRPYQTPPYGQNPYGQDQNPYGQNPYGQNPYGQNPYGQNQNPYGQDPFGGLYKRPVQQKRPLSTGLMVYSILNIVFGCCCFGMIFGIIGLMLAFKAQNSLTDREEVGKKKLSLAMNIIGTVLTIVYVVVYVIVFIQAGGDISALM